MVICPQESDPYSSNKNANQQLGKMFQKSYNYELPLYKTIIR
jgi:hypothetical protein